jgi:hypothetical protein
MLRTTRRALDTIDAAYSMQKQAVPAEDIHDTWINISRRGEVNVTWAEYSVSRTDRDPITAAVLFAVDRALALAGLAPTSIFDVLAAGADELWHFVRCDYESLQTCSKWRAHVVVTSVVVAVTTSALTSCALQSAFPCRRCWPPPRSRRSLCT